MAPFRSSFVGSEVLCNSAWSDGGCDEPVSSLLCIPSSHSAVFGRCSATGAEASMSFCTSSLPVVLCGQRSSVTAFGHSRSASTEASVPSCGASHSRRGSTTVLGRSRSDCGAEVSTPFGGSSSESEVDPDRRGPLGLEGGSRSRAPSLGATVSVREGLCRVGGSGGGWGRGWGSIPLRRGTAAVREGG